MNAERPPKYAICRCGHPNTLHAGYLWTCAGEKCPCVEFREKIRSEPEPPSAFQEVKEIMDR